MRSKIQNEPAKVTVHSIPVYGNVFHFVHPAVKIRLRGKIKGAIIGFTVKCLMADGKASNGTGSVRAAPVLYKGRLV